MTELHPLWLGPSPLVLASASRTRRDLLEAVGIPLEVRPAVIDERSLSAPLEIKGSTGIEIARALADAKSLAVSDQMPGRFVLGSDQTLSIGKQLLHKPAGRAEAHQQLRLLAGKTHTLHSAVTIALDGQVVARCHAVAELTMRELSDNMITRYLDAAGDAVTQSVGGYQFEGLGAHLFARVVGDHSTILGLPMLETLAALRSLELVPE